MTAQWGIWLKNLFVKIPLILGYLGSTEAPLATIPLDLNLPNGSPSCNNLEVGQTSYSLFNKRYPAKAIEIKYQPSKKDRVASVPARALRFPFVTQETGNNREVTFQVTLLNERTQHVVFEAYCDDDSNGLRQLFHGKRLVANEVERLWL